jgi:cysteinyl-tRNA synthetase
MNDLKFYNSLSKKKEIFEPNNKKEVRIYNCGPTVYKRQHVGNMRRFLFADFLRRTLEYFDYKVNEVMNFTDVGHLTEDEIDEGEDKVEKAAREMKVTPQQITEEQIRLFEQDIADLNIVRANTYAKASEHIPQMIEMIGALIERGHAYETETGVYFDVQSFPEYGKLSGNTLKDIEAGRRVEVRKEKRHPADFVLWVIDDKHLQKWESPWGVGYPGWHIECSAMSKEYLGDSIDIHTGGEDNRFPHHENEIAQSECATGERFAKLWMHNRHLQLGGEKMAKSEGRQVTLDTIREKGHSPLAFRLLVFGSHYRSKIDFTWEAMDAAKENLSSFEQLIRRLQEVLPAEETEQVEPDKDRVRDFRKALADDLNTPAALAIVQDYITYANKYLSTTAPGGQEVRTILATLMSFDGVLGIFSLLKSKEVPKDILGLAKQREEARANGDFKKADEVRKKVEKKGYRIEDDPKAPSGWRVIRL